MLGVRDIRRVAWRRLPAPQHYLGYLTITDEMIGLSGREEPTGIGVSLSIPCQAIKRTHTGTLPEEQLAGESTVVLEVADGVPIVVRPVGTDDLGLEALARKLRSAIELNPKSGRVPARSARPRRGWIDRASA
jgi:hypothetical protein